MFIHADYAVGRRFHGNLVAMQAGIPSIFIAHDERVLEMLSSLGFPYLSARAWLEASDKRALIESFIEKFDVDSSVNHYMTKAEKFQSHLHSIFG